MKPVLILGMGNPLMGDDGIGWRVAETLASDPRFPDDAEVICGGTDLLRWADDMEGRQRIILIDAVLGDGPPGTVEVFHDRFETLESRQWNVHHLSTPQALGLLRGTSAGLLDIRFSLLAVMVRSVQARPGLSPELNARLPEIVDLVLEHAG